jgi:hypothetical protein
VKHIYLASVLLAATACNAVADVVRMNAFIEPDTIEVAVDGLKVVLSGQLGDVSVNDIKILDRGRFSIACSDAGQQLLTISIPAAADFWLEQRDVIEAKAKLTSPSTDMLLDQAWLKSSVDDVERRITVDLKDGAGEIGRLWYSGSVVYLESSPGNGLPDIDITIFGSFPDANYKRQLGDVVKVCELMASR